MESDLFELSGVANTEGVKVEGNTITLTFDNLKAENVTAKGGNYQLAFENVTESKTTTAHFEGNIYKSDSNTAGYTLADNKITYTAAVPEKTFTLNNLNSNAKLGENIFVTDGDTTNFKFKAAALDKKSVEITGGKFSVELDNDVDTTAEEISESKVLTNNILTYRVAGTGEYYSTSATGVTING